MRSTGSSALASPVHSRSTPRGVLQKTAAVGRVGSLALEYVRQGGRTVFGRTSCRTPWHLLPPIYLDESGSAYTLLVNPSGGLVGGDHLAIDLSVGPQAHVLISTPSANRVYRSLSRDSVQEVTIRVAEQGILEWMPEHTIPFAGSRFRQNIDVKLNPRATLLLWDAVASGRVAHGERWRFTSLNNNIRITMPSHAAVQEHYALVPGDTVAGAGAVQEWDYVGSFFIIGDAVSAALWTSLEAALWDILDKHGDEGVLGGVSQPAVPGVVVKLIAASAPAMTSVLMDMWAAVRHVLWQMPPVLLRKY
jgi:urease accessory protein